MNIPIKTTNHSGFQGKLLKNILLGLMLALLLVVLWMLYKKINVFPLRDFVEYWASGRINNTGGNPYDGAQMLAMEQTVGWEDPGAVMMLNPPWTLPYAMFFGLFNYPFSRFLCFLFQISMVFLCSIILWDIYRANNQKKWIGWFVLLTFGPVLHTLKAGQITILVLLGSVGFIYFLNKKMDFWAGVFASLVLIKPHLLYLFVIVVIVWSISVHRYRIIFGMAFAVLASTGLAVIVNPHLIPQYIDMLRFSPPDEWMTSTLGGFLRALFGPDKFYLQYVPSLIGLAWFMWYWYKQHREFNWTNHLPKIIMISFATSAYGWTFDAAVVIWGIMQVAGLFDFRRWTIIKILIFFTYWGLNLAISFLSLSQNLLWWFPSALLIWYLLSIKHLPPSTIPLKNQQLPEVLT